MFVFIRYLWQALNFAFLHTITTTFICQRTTEVGRARGQTVGVMIEIIQNYGHNSQDLMQTLECGMTNTRPPFSVEDVALASFYTSSV